MAPESLAGMGSMSNTDAVAGSGHVGSTNVGAGHVGTNPAGTAHGAEHAGTSHADTGHSAGHAAGGHGRTGHVVSPLILGGVFSALLVLTFVTVAVTWIDLGVWNLWIAMFVATIKASLVVLFFMHLWWDRPVIGIVLVFALLLVGLFIGLALTDVEQWLPAQIPGYAPKVNG